MLQTIQRFGESEFQTFTSEPVSSKTKAKYQEIFKIFYLDKSKFNEEFMDDNDFLTQAVDLQKYVLIALSRLRFTPSDDNHNFILNSARQTLLNYLPS